MLIAHYSISNQSLRRCVLDAVVAHQKTWPQEQSMVIVPERLKLSYERELLETLARDSSSASAGSALLLTDVLSFSRLSGRILDQGGARRGETISSVAQTLRVARILQQHRDEMRCFSRLLGKPGFVKEILRLIGDCRRYRTRSEDLERVLERFSASEHRDPSFLERLHDLATLLRYYEEDLDADAIEDPSQLMLLASQVLDQAYGADALQSLKQTHIYITGFGDLRDFTPQEYALIESLERRCATLHLTVSADREPMAGEEATSGITAFEPGRQTLLTLRRTFPQMKVEALDASYSRTKQAFIRAWTPELPPVELAESRDLQEPEYRLVYAPSPTVAAELLAAYVHDLVARGVCRYRDICVLPLEREAELPRLKAAFDRYQIPAYLDTPQAMAASPLRNVILSLLNLARFGWEPEIAWTLARTGLLGTQPDQVDILENACLARGIDRRSFWDDQRYLKLSGDQDGAAVLAGEAGDLGRPIDEDEMETEDLAPEEEVELPEIERWEQQEDRNERSDVVRPSVDDRLLRLRNQIFAPVRQHVERLRSTRDLGERARILIEAIGALEIEAHLGRIVDQNLEAGETDQAESLVQAWNLTVQLLYSYVDEGEGIPCGLADAYAYFDYGIRSSIHTGIPSRMDQVLVTTGDVALQFMGKILLITGASADRFPENRRVTGLLSEDEKALLSEWLPSGFSHHETGQAGARYQTVWQYLTGFESVTLFHDGHPDQASRVFRVLKEHVEETELLKPGFSIESDQDIRYRETNKPLPSDADLDPTEKNLHRTLDTKLVQSLQSTPLSMSVSRLESYMACGYQYLQKELLKVTERQVYAPELNQMGTLLHKVYELFYQELHQQLSRAEAHDRETILTDELKALMHGALPVRIERLMKQALQEDSTLHVYNEPLYRASSAMKAERILRQTLIPTVAELLGQEHLNPWAQEWIFGMGGQPPYVLELPEGREVHFRGAIDRLDAYPDPSGGTTTYYRIMDYKSGTKYADHDRMYHGLDLQLPIYLEAVRSWAEARGETWSALDAGFYSLKPVVTHYDQQIRTPQAIEELDLKSLIKASQKRMNALKVPAADLDLVTEHAVAQAKLGLDQLQKGQLQARPKGIEGAMTRNLPCRYCKYQGICRIERPTAVYEPLEKVKSIYRAQHPGETPPNTIAATFLELLKGDPS